jgi:hypothetical protein
MPVTTLIGSAATDARRAAERIVVRDVPFITIRANTMRGRTANGAIAEVVKRLRILDRMGVIELLPGDRIRRRAKRDFDWIPDGPIRTFFAKQGLPDFLAGPFNPSDESLDFAHGMLTQSGQAELKLELRRLRSKLMSSHEQSVPAPLTEKDGIGLLLATPMGTARVSPSASTKAGASRSRAEEDEFAWHRPSLRQGSPTQNRSVS